MMVMHVDKLDEFKEFAKTKPFLKERVKKKETTWQELYEHYDLFGENDELFQEKEEKVETPTSEESEKEEKKEDASLGGILDALNGFNPEKISEGLSGMKKILNILGEVTKPEEGSFFSKRKANRPYQRNDD